MNKRTMVQVACPANAMAATWANLTVPKKGESPEPRCTKCGQMGHPKA